MANLEELTKRINVLVKTNNRFALEFQKALAKSESERSAIEEVIYRISRDLNDITDEIVIDEEYYGLKKAREAEESVRVKALLEVEKEREEAHKRIKEAEEIASLRIKEKEEVIVKKIESLEREIQVFKEGREGFLIAIDTSKREIETIQLTAKEKIENIEKESTKAINKIRRKKNIIIGIFSTVIPIIYFLGDYIDFLEFIIEKLL